MVSNRVPFFSVVLPVYNRAHSVGAAIGSVLNQTEPDFELIIVDDGSSDNPKSVVDAFCDRRIVFHRQANAGGGAARNAGIDRARGQFIAFIDSDDEFLPHHLAAMRAKLEGTQLIVGYARTIVDRGNNLTFLKPPRAIEACEDMPTYFFCDRGFVPTSTIVAPAEISREIRFHEDLREAEDTDFAVRLALAGCRFVMGEDAEAIWKDREDPNRLSAGRDMTRFAAWLETMKPKMSEKAYLGARGWPVAKHVAAKNKSEAMRLYLTALFRGCYRPRHAVIIFLQIFLTDHVYRRVADSTLIWLRERVRRSYETC